MKKLLVFFSLCSVFSLGIFYIILFKLPPTGTTIKWLFTASFTIFLTSFLTLMFFSLNYVSSKNVKNIIIRKQQLKSSFFWSIKISLLPFFYLLLKFNRLLKPIVLIFLIIFWITLLLISLNLRYNSTK